MGRDRQEKKLRKEGKVEADRDQSLHYGGATKLTKNRVEGSNKRH
ncbi:YpzI family protein [Radiobacillus kanasensis]|nr:YpzI family protein [Radiobacillus kanasensis]UFU00291.1 YpzI family protein [Radiobacillus kanasensis]